MLIVISRVGNYFNILDTDDMVVESITKTKLSKLNVQIAGVAVKSVNIPTNHQRQNNNSLDASGWYNKIIKDFYKPDISFCITVDTINYDWTGWNITLPDKYRFQQAVLNSMIPLEKSNNTYLKLYSLYQQYKGKVSIIQSGDFSGFMCFEYNNIFYLSNGVDFVSCPIDKLKDFYTRFKRLSKYSILQGLKFDMKGNYLYVDFKVWSKDITYNPKINELSLHSNIRYRFPYIHFDITTLHVYDKTELSFDVKGVKFEILDIYYYGNDFELIDNILKRCINLELTSVTCKHELSQKIKDAYPNLEGVYGDVNSYK